MTAQSPLLTIDELCRYLHISHTTYYERRTEAGFPMPALQRPVRYRLSSLDRYLDRSERTAESDRSRRMARITRIESAGKRRTA